MVLEASRQYSQALHNSRDPALAFRAGETEKKEKCEHCGSKSHSGKTCWIEHPDLAPSWFKEKMKELAKGGQGVEQAKKFQAIMTTNREDDFQDGYNTYISA